MKRISLLFWGIVMTLNCMAQMISIQGSYEPSIIRDAKLLVSPLAGKNAPPVEMVVIGKSFFARTPAAPDGLYSLWIVGKQIQVQVPFYVQSGRERARLKVTFVGKCPQVNIDNDNKALSAYNLVVWNKMRDIWLNAQVMPEVCLSSALQGFDNAADSVLKQYKPSAVVGQYIRLWAVMSTFNGYSAVAHVAKKSEEGGSMSFLRLYKDSSGVLDTEKTFYFTEAYRCLRATLSPRASLNELLEELHAKYSNTGLRRKMGDYIVGNFVSHYDYSTDYDRGLELVSSVVQRYALSTEHIKEYESHKASIGGQPFPAGLHLVDAAGNKVDFSSLRGSYVYVDLWASWCAPCRKEIPYLQRLEKEVKNPLVKFVSISIDRTEEPWRKAMTELRCDGNQWINADNALPQKLNVQGIPHFLIYDKHGNLLQYNAPRPSDPKLKAELEALR